MLQFNLKDALTIIGIWSGTAVLSALGVWGTYVVSKYDAVSKAMRRPVTHVEEEELNCPVVSRVPPCDASNSQCTGSIIGEVNAKLEHLTWNQYSSVDRILSQIRELNVDYRKLELQVDRLTKEIHQLKSVAKGDKTASKPVIPPKARNEPITSKKNKVGSAPSRKPPRRLRRKAALKDESSPRERLSSYPSLGRLMNDEIYTCDNGLLHKGVPPCWCETNFTRDQDTPAEVLDEPNCSTEPLTKRTIAIEIPYPEPYDWAEEVLLHEQAQSSKLQC